MAHLNLHPCLPGANVLTYCGLQMPYGDIIRVNIGSVNGLLPDGTKPLTEPMSTYQPSTTKIILNITCLKFHLNLPGFNELILDHVLLVVMHGKLETGPG